VTELRRLAIVMEAEVMRMATPFALVVIWMILGQWIWRHLASRSTRPMLRRWEKDHQCTIIRKQHRFLLRGPYWAMGNVQVVYRITVIDREGRMRRGWACCGSPFLGPLSDEIDVELDDIATAPSTTLPAASVAATMWDRDLDP